MKYIGSFRNFSKTDSFQKNNLGSKHDQMNFSGGILRTDRLGFIPEEFDLWMLEEKDGNRQDLFTETAFYRIGCSSPEVQLVRMIYKNVVT